MQNLVNEAPKKHNYDFIDHIRCIAMMAIVAEHVLGAGVALTPGTAKVTAYNLLTQLTKFGTITFFLLAGFLIGDKFTDYTPWQYLKRRFSNTFSPWLFWSVLFIVCFAINLKVKANMYHDDRFNWPNIWQEIQQVYLYTNYWFIINFMVSITLLLIFKKHLYSKWFGIALLACTLFYCVNAYYAWINPAHTTAILGYVFFLWLGAQLRKYWPQVEAAVNGLPYFVAVLAIIVTYLAANFEVYALTSIHSGHATNTLRFSNILYSLAVFTLLLKVRTIKGLNYLQPRQSTYGVYLIHPIILVFLTPEILRPLHIEANEIGLGAYIAYKLLFFLVTYGITLIVIRLINLTKGKTLIGN
ncbi:acyltransferase [Mucilaginibacter sp. PAMB04168]|uniref:acyltransferase n=1 Tax=Mucilaginibacter sp. PAMB04168 TaxID=3138567 RepID=UPI0031F687E8